MDEDRDAVDRALDQWAIEAPDLPTGPMGLLGRLSRAARLASAGTEEFLGRHGLTAWEFDVLATLRRSRADGPLTSSALAASTMVGSAATTRRVEQLVRRGLVQRGTNPMSRREVLIGLTPDGEQLVDDLLDDHVANQHRLVEGLSADEQQTMSDLLRRLLIAQGDGQSTSSS